MRKFIAILVGLAAGATIAVVVSARESLDTAPASAPEERSL